MAAKQGRFRVGTSGFHYHHWKGVFYPEGLPQSKWFSYYAERFDSVEINNTFYQLPPASTFDLWHEQAPPGFLYALKFSRYGSHWTRLKKPKSTIGKFLKVAERLETFLGPILVQLPPHWKANPQRLDAFLAAAPRSHHWVIEFRNPDWLKEEVYKILERHGAALCIHDMIANHPRVLTTDWTYLRYHGERYSGSYSRQKLAAEGRWIRRERAAGVHVFAYFNNDVQGFAVKNAAELRHHV